MRIQNYEWCVYRNNGMVSFNILETTPWLQRWCHYEESHQPRRIIIIGLLKSFPPIRFKREKTGPGLSIIEIMLDTILMLDGHYHPLLDKIQRVPTMTRLSNPTFKCFRHHTLLIVIKMPTIIIIIIIIIGTAPVIR